MHEMYVFGYLELINSKNFALSLECEITLPSSGVRMVKLVNFETYFVN